MSGSHHYATKFRNSLTGKEGHVPAKIVQGSIVNVNLTKWTIDVATQFDRKRYFDIQVGSPYMHHANGEGFSASPEVGATAMVCLPSDSAPPFVVAHVMAPETVNDSAPDAPLGTSSHGQAPLNATGSSYYGGRQPLQAGDMSMSTRDGNFVTLRRGGVLQMGATPLSQRICVPLGNLMTDISGGYEHHNSNGSIVWGMQAGASETQTPSQFMQTFRVFATTSNADIRVAVGKVYTPLPDPDGGIAAATAKLGSAGPVIYELAVSPSGFTTESGVAAEGAGAASVLKFTFDQQGNVLMRAAGNIYVQCAMVLTLDITGSISIQSKDAIGMTAVNGFDLDGGAYANIKGKVVRLNAGTNNVASYGDLVSIPTTLPFYVGALPIPVITPTGPGAIAPGTPIFLSSKPGVPSPLVGQITKTQNQSVKV